jgi:CotH kinase protein/Lamin Tail Domain/Chitobiase/beta-hexosaminidase C-terminal domain
MNKLLFTLVLIFFASILSAQILINEISAANLSGLTDEDGDREDWVELYNSGSSSVNISGWFLSDNPNKPQKWIIPNGTTINAGAYRIFFCSGKDRPNAAIKHTNFKITQTKGESVVLTQADGTLADNYTFTIPNQGNHSYGRSPNGSSTWKIYTTPTPGVANTGSAYQAYAPAVQATLDAGFYTGTAAVALSTSAGFTIRYTTNGSEPTSTSSLYSTTLNFSSTTVLKARAFSSNAAILNGFVMANTYFININHVIPVLSIAGTNLNTLLNGSQITPYGSFEYFENKILKDEAYGEFNKHGNDSWSYPQRGIDWITRDQMGYKDELKNKFFKERTRTKFQRLILKAAANDNYPAENGAHIRDSYVHTLAVQGGLDVDARTHTSCVMYVNGQYWGVYDLREKADDADFTSYYYDQDEPDIDYIKTWGNTWQEYGSWTDWYTLKSFILGNNMAVAANYDYVEQQFDLLSLVDYIIINQHSVCKDWLNWNTAWWRGRNPDGKAKRWRYALWDMDATFGHYINYTGIPNVGPTADPCDVEQIPSSGDPENHVDLLMALFANPEFKALYVNRYADLLNGPLSCQNMNALLDEMTNAIAPEMAQQCLRWGGTVAQWQQNVQSVHDFINTRCQVLEPSIVDCYDVTGPFALTVNISPASSPNQVKVNTITPTTYPYIGDYFGTVNIDLIAKPATDWQFDHWEVSGNSFGPDQYAAAILLAFETNGVSTAFFVPTSPCTEPTGLATSDLLTIPSVNWTGPLSVSSYDIKYRKLGDPIWTDISTNLNTWKFDTLPGCSNYEMQIRSVCPQSNSPFTDFTFATPDKLTGFGMADAVICNDGMAVLDATLPSASVIWDNGSNDPIRSLTDPGKYWVEIKLGNCTRTDTVNVSKITAIANIQPVLCAGTTFTLGNEVFDEQRPTGQVILKNMATSACDSIVNVSLKYLAPIQNNILNTSCNPAAVGVDTVMLKNMAGCDSLVITSTSLSNISQVFLTAKSCNPNLVGTDTLMFSNQLGCDSLVITTTSFDASAISTTSFFVKNCDPANVGVDTVLLKNVAGCDSLVITTTSLAPKSQIFLTATSCNPALIGTDTLILANHFGCDSLVITTTSLAPKSQIFLTATSCNPAFIGTDTLLLANHFGCDSLVITTTTFDANAFSTTKFLVKNCDPANVGVDTVFLKNVAGCDSLVITTTSLAPISQTFLTATSCNPAFIGTDTLLLANHLGCDSLVITTTSFDANAVSTTTLFMKNCDPANVGMDTVLLKNVAGCDSLVITNTSLAPISQIFLTAKSCNPAFIGTDTLVLANHLGCDSLVITTTSFDANAVSTTTLFVKNCDPTNVGVDTILLKNVAGCDSLVITNTSLAPISQIFLMSTSCNPDFEGTDTLRLSNQFGCDSLVITTTFYTGLDLELSSSQVLCFGGKDGFVQLDSVLTIMLPVELTLTNHPTQLYTGTPLLWKDLSAGNYTLTATNSMDCSTSQDITITESAPLLLDLGSQPIVLHLGDSIWVEPIADFQIAIAEWSPTSGVQCPTCPNTIIHSDQTTRYLLTAYDLNGCSTSTSLTVQVEQGVRVYMPNIIDLNSEDADLTIFGGPEVERIRTLQLFDRWGNKIFEQNDLAPNVPSAWDGTYRGKLLHSGVIVWFCEVETIDGRKVRLDGDITIIR